MGLYTEEIGTVTFLDKDRKRYECVPIKEKCFGVDNDCADHPHTVYVNSPFFKYREPEFIVEELKKFAVIIGMEFCCYRFYED